MLITTRFPCMQILKPANLHKNADEIFTPVHNPGKRQAFFVLFLLKHAPNAEPDQVSEL